MLKALELREAKLILRLQGKHYRPHVIITRLHESQEITHSLCVNNRKHDTALM